jgi:hypothetical protein
VPESAAARWIRELALAPHPEGGWYRETYRAGDGFPGPAHQGFPAGRSLSTAIYFLLQQGHFSAFHRIRSDELWHHYDGDGVDVHIIGPGGELRVLGLGRGAGRQPQAVVPAGCWFASEVSGGGAYALLGCTVAPGFHFADFELADGIELAAAHAQHAALVRRLTRPGDAGTKQGEES